MSKRVKIRNGNQIQFGDASGFRGKETVVKSTRFTSAKGDIPAERITVLNLLHRMELMPDLKMDQMIEALGVDKDELYAILDNVARAIPRDPFQMTCGTLRGILSWGVAIGYFYGKQNPTLKVN